VVRREPVGTERHGLPARPAAWALAAGLALLLARPGAATAHPADDALTGLATASGMLERTRTTFPLRALTATSVLDGRAEAHPFALDIAGLSISAQGDTLTFAVDLHQPTVPEPQALLLHFAFPGDRVPRWSAFQDEDGRWGLYRLAAGGWGHERVADAVAHRSGRRVEIAMAAADLPAGELLVYAHTAGYDPSFTPTFDVAPNDRRGLVVPLPEPHPRGDLAPRVGRIAEFAGPL